MASTRVRSATRRGLAGLLGAGMLVLVAWVAAPGASAGSATPSTNEENRARGWAHVTVVHDDVPGQITLELVSRRPFLSCFEYRTDGDTGQAVDPANFNPEILDGLYPYQCVRSDGTATKRVTLSAAAFVEVRMVFGAERDERFDWTRFDVAGKDDCKRGGWMELVDGDRVPFRNQGACVGFAASGR